MAAPTVRFVRIASEGHILSVGDDHEMVGIPAGMDAAAVMKLSMPSGIGPRNSFQLSRCTYRSDAL
jgi:hypothetical protein